MPGELNLVRHVEAVGNEDLDPGLSDRRRAQALALGGRLASVQLAGILHGPRRRANETARVVAKAPPRAPAESTPLLEDRTHSFVIGRFVRELLGAPTWRWLRPAPANASLRLPRRDGDGSVALVSFNDTGLSPVGEGGAPRPWPGVPCPCPYACPGTRSQVSPTWRNW
jgi:hypothetical protein